MVFRCLDPHQHHSINGVIILVAVHGPDARVITDEADDNVAVRRHSDRVLDDWIDAIPRRRPVYNIIQPTQDTCIGLHLNNLRNEWGEKEVAKKWHFTLYFIPFAK